MRMRRRERGFSLMSALFIVVVLSALGALMLKVGSLQQAGAAQTLLGTRADYAARSGLEWGIRQALDTGGCPADTSFALSEGGLAGFQISVTCTSSSHTEGSTASRVYQLLATASRGSFGGRDYIRRRVQGTFTDAP